MTVELMDQDGTLRGDMLVDGHVHFHACFEVRTFLDSAVRNFRAGAWELGLNPSIDGCLLLAECAGDRFFERLKGGDHGLKGDPWHIRETGEASSLLAERDDGARLLLIAGRQIVTGEGVEVLALGSPDDFEDGRPLRDTLAAAERSSAIPVLPWGLGKWLFQRGALVASVLAERDRSTLFLGDNGGRPRLAPLPGLFRTGATRGVRVLPGSDPLPMPRQQYNVARYGFVLEGVSASRSPGRSVIGSILEADAQPRFFGSGEWIGGFLRAQLALQWKTRGRTLVPAGNGGAVHG